IGSSSHVLIKNSDARVVRMVRKDAGWYPEPEASWIDLQRHSLKPHSENNRANGKGLLSIESSVLVTELRKIVPCSNLNSRLNQKKE
ncbi:hypothetical protein DBR06_SOUSAS810195, partial [Sousa chinensis]